MKRSTVKITCLFLFFPLLFGCGGKKKSDHIRINGIESKVQKVLNGNTVELQNGLKVEIFGIKPSLHTKEYLERFAKGETVVIIADSEYNKHKSHIRTYKTKVKAYVKIKKDKYCLSGKMLRNRTAKLDINGYTDSLTHFKQYAQDSIPNIMTSTELREYMRNASFLISTSDGAIGTGFFINNNGLALTNNHVLDGKKDARIFFFKENGEPDTKNYRTINRYLLTESGGKIDFTVFLVQLDNDEQVRYMPLINQHEKEGEQIAKLGCPVGLTCDFKTGVLSNYYDGFLCHSCPSNHGDSGGPIANMRGQVIGVNQSIEFNESFSKATGTLLKAEGIAYAVDALLIRNILDQNGIEYGR